MATEGQGISGDISPKVRLNSPEWALRESVLLAKAFIPD